MPAFQRVSTELALVNANGAIEVTARSRSTGQPGTLGGDFYSRCTTRHGTRLLLGSVWGRGVPAAHRAIFLRGAFLTIAATTSTLNETSAALDRTCAALCTTGRDDQSRESFATAVLAQIDPRAREVTIINHAHPAPILLSAGSAQELAPAHSRLPLGLGALTQDFEPTHRLTLSRGEALALSSDGASSIIDRSHHLDSDTMLQSLIAELSGLADGTQDGSRRHRPAKPHDPPKWPRRAWTRSIPAPIPSLH